jgi:DNA-binding winged helix-turn-helix (wHTH) protein
MELLGNTLGAALPNALTLASLKPARQDKIYDFGQFSIDCSRRLLLRKGKPVPLAAKLFDLLVALVQEAPYPVEKNQLMDEVWPDTFVEESNLTVSIAALRKALGRTGKGKRYIETLPKRGYRFSAPVKVTSPAPSHKTRPTSSITEFLSRAQAPDSFIPELPKSDYSMVGGIRMATREQPNATEVVMIIPRTDEAAPEAQTFVPGAAQKFERQGMTIWAVTLWNAHCVRIIFEHAPHSIQKTPHPSIPPLEIDVMNLLGFLVGQLR